MPLYNPRVSWVRDKGSMQADNVTTYNKKSWAARCCATKNEDTKLKEEKRKKEDLWELLSLAPALISRRTVNSGQAALGQSAHHDR